MTILGWLVLAVVFWPFVPLLAGKEVPALLHVLIALGWAIMAWTAVVLFVADLHRPP